MNPEAANIEKILGCCNQHYSIPAHSPVYLACVDNSWTTCRHLGYLADYGVAMLECLNYASGLKVYISMYAYVYISHAFTRNWRCNHNVINHTEPCAYLMTFWRHDFEPLSALMALCEENPPMASGPPRDTMMPMRRLCNEIHRRYGIFIYIYIHLMHLIKGRKGKLRVIFEFVVFSYFSVHGNRRNWLNINHHRKNQHSVMSSYILWWYVCYFYQHAKASHQLPRTLAPDTIMQDTDR